MPHKFDDRALRTHLQKCGFSKENIVPDFIVGSQALPLLVFSHRPFDTRTACAAASPPSGDAGAFLDAARATSSPFAFVGSGQKWDVWQTSQGEPSRFWSADRGSLDAFFKAYGDQLEPRALFRAKTLTSPGGTRQLSLVDAGLLEMIESEASMQLCGLIERMIDATREKLGMADLHHLVEMDAQWLVQANFRLLAARLLHDKGVKGFKSLDLLKIDDVFSRVDHHYGSGMTHTLSPRRLKALLKAVEVLEGHSSLRLVSTETLARVYEEVLVTKETRKELGTHSTPSWLVNYIVRRLAPLVEDQAPDRRRVFEPGCGHAPFLVAMLRLFSGMEPCVDLDDLSRHRWLRERLRGAETDDFAREVARLSLTLADIPNKNGWYLDEGNMFAGDLLKKRIENADIILSNPPFENRASSAGELFHVSQAAELLRLINLHSKPGTILAYIMPQTILDSKKTCELRRSLLQNFEWHEILRLPDKVFDKADVETAVLIGRKRHQSGAHTSTTVECKHVWDGTVDEFACTGRATVEQVSSGEVMLKDDLASMLIPDLAEVWDYCSGYVKLGDVAHVGNGMIYFSEEKKDENGNSYFPVGEKQVATARTPGYQQGFYNWRGASHSHLLPALRWMNTNPAVVARRRSGYATGIRQIVMNHIRVQRGPWRLKAYIDEVGRRACGDFLLVRPHENGWSLNSLWALLNSPLANAFTFSFSAKKHIYGSLLVRLPIPSLDEDATERLDSLVGDYLDAARRYFPASAPKDAKRKSSSPAGSYLKGFEPSVEGDEETRAKHSEELKARLARVDEELFRLYALPPELERKVLDYFTGYKRPGVPFEQVGFYPPGFKGGDTLHNLIAITTDWDANNERRLALIEKEFRSKLNAVERAELERLQELATLHRRLEAPYPMEEIDAEIERLKREGTWIE